MAAGWPSARARRPSSTTCRTIRGRNTTSRAPRRPSPPQWRRGPKKFTRPPPRRLCARFRRTLEERLRALGYVASSSSPSPAAGARNPTATIAILERVRRGARRARRPSPQRGGRASESWRQPTLRRPGVSGDLRARTEGRGPAPGGARHVSAGAATLADRCRDVCTISPSPRARPRTWRRTAAQRVQCVRRRHGPTRRHWPSIRTAPPPATASASWRSDGGHHGVAVKAFEQRRPRLTRTTRRTGRISATPGAPWATARAPSRRTAGRSRSTRARPTRRTASVSSGRSQPSGRGGTVVRTGNRRRARFLVEARLNLGIALQQSGQKARAEETYRQVLAAPARHKRERDAASKLLAALGAVR